MKRAAAVILGALAVYCTAVFADGWNGGGRRSAVAMALIPEEARETASRSGYSIEDFWERARTIGVNASVLESERVGALLDRGEAVRFDRPEFERWRMAGLIASNSPVKAGAIWTRDAGTMARIAEAARLQGLSVSTQSFPGQWMLDVEPSDRGGDLRVGFDPASYRWAVGGRLTPVFHLKDDADAAALDARVLQTAASGSVRIYLWDSGAGARGMPHLADRPSRPRVIPAGFWGADSWIALRGRWSDRFPEFRELSSRMITAADVDASGAMASVWRRVIGHGDRLLIVHLSPERGVEENLEGLRTLARGLQSAGYRIETPAPDLVRRAPSAPEAGTRRFAILLLAILAPLFAIRQGLRVLRSAAAERRWPLAFPVPELIAGSAVVLAAASALGAAAYAVADFPQWRMGFSSVPWAVVSIVVPAVLCASTLYAAEIPGWIKKMSGPVTYVAAVRWAILAVAAVFLFDSARGFLVFGPALNLSDSWWWLAVRWREVLVGVPCLLVGMAKYLRRLHDMEKSHERKSPMDPRPWLLAGVLAPAGLVNVFGSALAPLDALAVQTCEGWLIGMALGGILLLVLS